MTFRSRKLTDSARGEECCMQAEVCNHNSETTVFCHFNEGFAGKGMGQKGVLRV